MSPDTSRTVTLLEQFRHGKAIEGGQTVGGFGVTAVSSGLARDSVERRFFSVSFGSYDAVDDLSRLQHGYGLLSYDTATCALVHVRRASSRDRGYFIPDYAGILIPIPVLSRFQGNLTALIDLCDRSAVPEPIAPNAPPLLRRELPAPRPLSLEEEVQRAGFLKSIAAPGRLLSQVLGALVQGRPVSILNAPIDPAWRLELVQGLLVLLPPPVRHTATFATEVFQNAQCTALLKLLYVDPRAQNRAGDVEVDWSRYALTNPPPPHAYADFIARYWDRGPDTLVQAIRDGTARSLEAVLTRKPALPEALGILGRRLILTQQVADHKMTPDDLAKVLETDDTLTLSEKREYAPQLFDMAVIGRGAELVQAFPRLGLLGEVSPELSQHARTLTKGGHGRIVSEIVRGWLASSAGPQVTRSLWLSVLREVTIAHIAYLADHGMDQDLVVFARSTIAEANPTEMQTLWPQIETALRSRASQSDTVAQGLFELTARHRRDELPRLVQDDTVRKRLPPPIRSFAQAVLTPSSPSGVEPGLLVRASQSLDKTDALLPCLASFALESGSPVLLDVQAWDGLRKLATRAPESDSAIRALSTKIPDSDWVRTYQKNAEAVWRLVWLRLTLSLWIPAVTLLAEVTRQGVETEHSLSRRLVETIKTDERLADRSRTESLLEALSSQTRVGYDMLWAAYLAALRRHDWTLDKAVLGVASLLEESPERELTPEEQLRLLQRLAVIEDGAMAKKAVQGVVSGILAPTKITPSRRIQRLSEVAEQLKGKPALRGELTRLICQHAQSLDETALARFEEGLRANVALKDDAAAVATIVMMRRILKTGSLTDFVDKVNRTAFFLHELGAATRVAPGSKAGAGPDWVAFEKLLLEQGKLLPGHEREVFATNCKVLARIIGELGDARRRSGILKKSEDQINRDLFQGRSDPDNVVDLLKWLGGLFGGDRPHRA